MVKIWIDDVRAEVEEGASVLEAARAIGLDLPAMCNLADHSANTSCMCCLVKVEGNVVPSCSTQVREGLRVESETTELHDLRRTGIELLLGDHAGDCHAPCENTCPARMDIPDMLRLVADGDYAGALATVKRDIALPAILGRVCPEVCENACRRGQHDSPASICKIKQFVADVDLKTGAPYQPRKAPPSGKRVAIIGAGPTGLTAAFHLSQAGHDCTVIDQHDKPGGRLLEEFPADQLPRDVLQAEAEVVLGLGAATRLGERMDGAAVEALVAEFDAVLLTTGRPTDDWLQDLVTTTRSGVKVDAQTRMTSRERVFAAGNAVRPYKLVVQSVAEGKLAATCIDCWLKGAPPPDRRRAFETRLARLTNHELCDFCDGYPETPRADPVLLADQLSEAAAQAEAARCLQCDCSALANCQLHHYASMYDCDAKRFRGDGRPFEGRIVGEHVTVELGKCILCGICVQIADEAEDAAGLEFLGRSTETRLGPPHGYTIDQALGSAAQQCAEACPTGAIVLATAHRCGNGCS